MYEASEPLAKLLFDHFPCFAQEMSYRQLTAQNESALKVFGDRIMLQIANVGNQIAVVDRDKKTICLANPIDGTLHPVFVEKLARYLEALPTERNFMMVQSMLAKELYAWVKAKSATVDELGLRLDKTNAFIELDCRQYANA